MFREKNERKAEMTLGSAGLAARATSACVIASRDKHSLRKLKNALP
jgi:hypothetical protein